jgi:hypothetical protein
MFPSFVRGFPDASWEASARQLGEQLHDLARCANTLAADNPGWIAPSQIAVARRLVEAAAVLRSHAEQVVPRT